jgi:BASS family bile acid:Na+ symporter
MEALKAAIPVLLTLSLAGLVLAVGLHASRGDLVYVLRRPRLLLKAILAVIVIPPIAAGVLVALLPIDPVVKAGIMLMAVSPVPPLVPGKELKVGARKEYAYGVYVAMALLTIVSVPLVLAIASWAFGRHDYVSIGRVASMVLAGVLVPLAIGLIVNRVAPRFAERAWSVVYKLSMVAVVLAFLPILITAYPAMVSLVGDGALAAMAVATVISLVGGHLLGGADLCDRATLAMASSVRHPGIAIMIAGAVSAEPRVSAAILMFVLVGLVVSIPYQAWVKRKLRSVGEEAEEHAGHADLPGPAGR